MEVYKIYEHVDHRKLWRSAIKALRKLDRVTAGSGGGNCILQLMCKELDLEPSYWTSISNALYGQVGDEIWQIHDAAIINYKMTTGNEIADYLVEKFGPNGPKRRRKGKNNG